MHCCLSCLLTQEPLLTCMTVSPPHKRVLVGGRTVDSFEVSAGQLLLVCATVVLARLAPGGEQSRRDGRVPPWCPLCR